MRQPGETCVTLSLFPGDSKLKLAIQTGRVAKLQLVQDPAAVALLESNPFALWVGMLLDQQLTTR